MAMALIICWRVQDSGCSMSGMFEWMDVCCISLKACMCMWSFELRRAAQAGLRELSNLLCGRREQQIIIIIIKLPDQAIASTHQDIG
jgi:hypothetical protein